MQLKTSSTLIISISANQQAPSLICLRIGTETSFCEANFGLVPLRVPCIPSKFPHEFVMKDQPQFLLLRSSEASNISGGGTPFPNEGLSI